MNRPIYDALMTELPQY